MTAEPSNYWTYSPKLLRLASNTQRMIDLYFSHRSANSGRGRFALDIGKMDKRKDELKRELVIKQVIDHFLAIKRGKILKQSGLFYTSPSQIEVS